MIRATLLSLCLVAYSQPAPADKNVGTFPEGQILAPLMDPAKLAMLGGRGVNRRLQKITAWLADGKQQGRGPELISGEIRDVV